MPEWQATGLADLQVWFSQGEPATVTDVVEKIGRKKPIPFDQFARDFRSAFESTATAR